MATLTGKVALVTGASRGIGAAIAKRLAADGASVAITYSSSKPKADDLIQSLRAQGARAIAIQADAADPAAAAASVQQTVAEFGGLDIVVCNAGIIVLGDIASVSDADFEHILSVNVRSAFYTVRAAVPHLRDNGRIIFIGSINSDSMPFAGGSIYALTKGAIASFTRGLARDLAPRNITVNNIQPGPVDTDGNPASGPFAQTLLNLMAVKRYGRGDEIGALVSFLAGPEAAFITGTGIKFDGGFDA